MLIGTAAFAERRRTASNPSASTDTARKAKIAAAKRARARARQSRKTATAAKVGAETAEADEGALPSVDFESEDTFFDISEAISSEQYVHRTILSTVIRYTSQFNLGRFYINHLLGYDAIFQRGSGTGRWISAVQGIAFGYLSKSGHGVDLSLNLGHLSYASLTYRYVIRTDNFYNIWPYFGAGVGNEIRAFRISDPPAFVPLYSGSSVLGYGTLGVLIPLVDLGFRAEVRIASYGALDRLVLSQTIGAFIFL